MKKNVLWILAALAFVVVTPGCIATSGQITADFDLALIHAHSTTDVSSAFVDLDSNKDYADHKDNMKGLADLAILGDIANNGSDSVAVEVWYVDGESHLTTAAAVRLAGVQMWGPFRMGVGDAKTIDWDGSAALFTTAGKAAMISKLKTGGSFTLYAIAAAGDYDFTITRGKLILTLDAGL